MSENEKNFRAGQKKMRRYFNTLGGLFPKLWEKTNFSFVTLGVTPIWAFFNPVNTILSANCKGMATQECELGGTLVVVAKVTIGLFDNFFFDLWHCIFFPNIFTKIYNLT